MNTHVRTPLFGPNYKAAITHQTNHRAAHERFNYYMEVYEYWNARDKPHSARWALDMAKMFQEDQRRLWQNYARCMGKLLSQTKAT